MLKTLWVVCQKDQEDCPGFLWDASSKSQIHFQLLYKPEIANKIPIHDEKQIRNIIVFSFINSIFYIRIGHLIL